MKRFIFCLLFILSFTSTAGNKILHCKQQIIGITKTGGGSSQQEVTRLSKDDNLVIDTETSFNVISSNGQHIFSPLLSIQSNGDLRAEDGMGLSYVKSKGIYMIPSNKYSTMRYAEWITFRQCTD